MSTAAVHGLTPPPGSETEDAPVRAAGDNYCDNKRRAERVVARFGRQGMSTVILPPSIVYGPYSAGPLAWYRACGKTPLLSLMAVGICNTTYVDNLIDAIFLSSSLDNEASSGETFFITDGKAITWGDFIRAHVAMLGPCEPLPEISSEQILAYYEQRPGLLTGSIKATAQVLRGSPISRTSTANSPNAATPLRCLGLVGIAQRRPAGAGAVSSRSAPLSGGCARKGADPRSSGLRDANRNSLLSHRQSPTSLGIRTRESCFARGSLWLNSGCGMRTII